MRSTLNTLLVAVCLMASAAMGQQPVGDQAGGPLRVHPTNPRYFTDGTENLDGSLRAIYLTGSHTWNNLVDMGRDDPPKAFDFDAYLDFLERHGHNFIRLWAFDSTTWHTRASSAWVEKAAIYHVAPQPWQRTGPGKALDGKPKFDLEKFDPAYFERLRARVKAAGQRGIYVSVMLFEGWVLSFDSTSSGGHPFRMENNVQGINGDPNGDGKGQEVQTLTIPSVTAAQEAYVRKVIDTVNDLDNVLYEISNEARLLDPARSTKDWQYHMIRFIKNEEAKKPWQHPVGMTSQGFGGGDDSEILLNSPADWISPSPDKSDYKNNPPASDGKKVILLDTDHLWGIGGDAAWVWKSFLRGHNLLFMDPYEHLILGKGRPDQWEGARQAMGATRRLAARMDLAAMTPSLDLASTKYCLANPGQEYLVCQPGTGEFSMDLTAGSYAFEWFNPATGSVASTGSVKAAGGNQTFTPPFSGPAVLYLKVASAEPGAASRTTPAPKLGISADKFTIGGQPTFLLGVSYFDALGWSNADLDALQARRFNLIRIFLDWSILAIKDGIPSPLAPRGFLNSDGSLKNTEALLNLVRACAARGIVVDVTILNALYDAANPTSTILDMQSRENAVRNAVRLLKHEPNVFFDVCNEHDVAWNGKTTTLTHAEVAALIRAALAEHPGAIVTVSSGGDHLPNARNTREELDAGVLLIAPHFQRDSDWFDRTDDRVKAVKTDVKTAGRNVPVYLQEEQRRGWSKTTSPPKSEFLQAAREAVSSGAAGWVFHTVAGFDLRSSNLLANLDSVEKEVLDSLGAGVFGAVPAPAEESRVLRVHPTNPRCFTDQNGRPFFWLADTGWEMVHRLTREEVDQYLENRAAKGFTVIQAQVLTEHGLAVPNRYGHLSLFDNDPTRPNEDYFKHVDYVVDRATARGLFVALVPTWGDKVRREWGLGPEIFNVNNARTYGEFLGRRYRDRPVIWILGGDRSPVGYEEVWRALATGLKAGDGGDHLMTYHGAEGYEGQGSSLFFHDESWLGFNMAYSGHMWAAPNYEQIARDYALAPVKPTLDGEPRYENHPYLAAGKQYHENPKAWDGRTRGDAHQMREAAYWAMLAGAAGHTYGCNDIWQFYHQGRKPITQANTDWHQALDFDGARQMGIMRRLFEARPWYRLVPAQSVIAAGQGEGEDHIQAARADDGSFLLAYLPLGHPVTMNLDKVSGRVVKAHWFNPREGTWTLIGEYPAVATREFTPPSSGPTSDWVLVLDSLGAQTKTLMKGQ